MNKRILNLLLCSFLLIQSILPVKADEGEQNLDSVEDVTEVFDVSEDSDLATSPIEEDITIENSDDIVPEDLSEQVLTYDDNEETIISPDNSDDLIIENNTDSSNEDSTGKEDDLSQYSILFNADEGGELLTTQSEETVSSFEEELQEGECVAVKAHAKDNYEFGGWFVEDNLFSENDELSICFSDLEANTSFRASFNLMEENHVDTFEEPQIKEVTLTDTDNLSYRVTVKYSSLNNIPIENTKLLVEEIDSLSNQYSDAVSKTEEELNLPKDFAEVIRLFDIKIVDVLDNTIVYEPVGDVDVCVELLDSAVEHFDNIEIVHIDDSLSSSSVLENNVDENEISFKTDGFSVFAVAAYNYEKVISASDGNSYKISVTFDKNSGLGKDSSLEVKEILPESEDYEFYSAEADDAISEFSAATIRLFDISILDSNGTIIEPDGTVSVNIQMLDFQPLNADVAVVHLDESKEVFNVEKDFISFKTDSFSVYAVVTGPEPVEVDSIRVTSLQELASVAGSKDIYMAHISGVFFTATQYVIKDSRTGILKTGVSDSIPVAVSKNAAPYRFVPVSGQTNVYKIYTKDSNGTVKYIKQNTNSLLFTNSESDATAFTIEEFPGEPNTFRVKGTNDYCFNQQGNASGKGFAAYNSLTDVNAKIMFMYLDDIDDDPLGLDGKTYGMVNRRSETTVAAMLGEEKTVNGHTGLSLRNLISRVNTIDVNTPLYVDNNNSISLWTFENVEADTYYLSTETEGVKKYISVSNGDITLVTTPDANCVAKVVPGIGNYAGKVKLLYDGVSICYNSNGFTLSGGNGANEYQTLVEPSVFTEEDFITFTATKVSVSDTDKLVNGSKVVIYTQRWNPTKKTYEFFLVNHDGSLVQGYESGDSINWIGAQVNTFAWEFTEYYYEGTNTPNYYYDLQNTYSGKYLAPEIDGTFLADSPIGVNLVGRKYGDYYSTIIAWDDPYYDYAGLRTNSYDITADYMANAEMFYFAIIDEEEVVDELHTVDTIDHVSMGLTMKMVNFVDRAQQNAVIVDNSYTPTQQVKGLLSSDLVNGYPVSTQSGLSLSQLFSGGVEVNNLFIKSTYDSSGYYEFDSSQNFAHLDLSSNKFVVYKELGTIDYAHGNTVKHGQFMPYNDITAGQFATINPENLYDASGRVLDDSDPRKHERLYSIPLSQADYNFGMEINAEFMQTPSGKDAWGHDIIFEFSGDDDFWLYVDGELAIDLGGIHGALPGSINYRTGEIKVNGVASSLYEIFKADYEEKHPSATDAEIEAFINTKFKLNENNQYVFKDYSLHTMTMFFMERGEGASNLRMRFNLANTMHRQLLLSKTISGTDKPDYVSAEFPFQIFYDLGDGLGCTNPLIADNVVTVKYLNTNENVKYLASHTVDNVTYSNVFFLKPGQTAAIRLPENAISYRVTECGVKENIYDEVRINGELTTGISPSGSTNTKYYESTAERFEDRARITFDNHINPLSLRTLTIKKRLFDENNNELTAVQDPTGFRMRLYMGENLDYFRFGHYYIKNPSNEYVTFNSSIGSFVSTGQTNWNNLSDEQKRAATFTSSGSGAIDKIQAGYSIEIRELPVDTRFKVEEKDYDIPKGYKLKSYERVDGSFISDPLTDTENSGTIRDNNDPTLEIHNKRGWYLSITKRWSDIDFVASHDDVFVAVYNTRTDSLLPNTVRRLTDSNLTASVLLDSLDTGSTFSDYGFFEVLLGNSGGNLSEDPDTGRISGWDTIDKIDDDDSVQYGVTNLDSTSATYTYEVNYERGQVKGAVNNVREDVARNLKYGLKIVKEDWNGNALEDARFAVSTGGVELGRYSSDEDGFVRIIYPEDNSVYNVEEILQPDGYQRLMSPLSITTTNGSFTFSGLDSSYYSFSNGNGDDMPTVTLKNKMFSLVIKNLDTTNSNPVANEHFALYKQVSSASGPRKDYYPLSGYEDIVSTSSGAIIELNESLPAGTYYLTEIQEAGGYILNNKDICFTISDTGYVSIASGTDYEGTLTEADGSVHSYQITIPARRNSDVNLTIEKNVLGGFGDVNLDFTFTLQSVSNSSLGDSYLWTKTSANNTVTNGSITAGGTFTLKDGEKITITLPVNEQVVIVESNEKYAAEWIVDNNTISSNTLTVTLTDDKTVSINNTLFEVAVTGVRGGLCVYLVILGIGIALLLQTAYLSKLKALLNLETVGKQDYCHDKNDLKIFNSITPLCSNRKNKNRLKW